MRGDEALAEMAGAAVQLEGVSYTYPGAAEPTLRSVSLEVPAGQCVVVTGPSGCGKTTLSRLVNGLVPHVYAGEVTGRVLVGGTEVAAWTPDELGVRVGSVFQNPRSQFVNLDVASEIAFGCENLGLPRAEIVERVEEAAAALGIRPLLDRSIEELSGGQKQAVILASALAMRPAVFVLDEPTASMMRLAEVVAALKAQGKTVIVSEHRLWWLHGVADRVVLMEEGSVAGDWDAASYGALPRAERAALGMRAWTVAEMEEEMATRVEVAPHAGAASGPTPVTGAATAEGLAAEGLTVAFRRNPPVLEGLSLTVAPGRVLGIVGRNGAGKTTLLRCLSGLARERAGSVALDGRALAARERPGTVHLVMQEPGYQLFADSARAELRLPDAEADELLAAFGLAACAERHPLSLSGGERQRLAIAAGIAQGARALVLDEPTSGLDRANMERVAAALRRVAAAGAPVALVTHDYEFLCAVCDEVAEVEGGRVSARYDLDPAHAARVRTRFGF